MVTGRSGERKAPISLALIHSHRHRGRATSRTLSDLPGLRCDVSIHIRPPAKPARGGDPIEILGLMDTLHDVSRDGERIEMREALPPSRFDEPITDRFQASWPFRMSALLVQVMPLGVEKDNWMHLSIGYQSLRSGSTR